MPYKICLGVEGNKILQGTEIITLRTYVYVKSSRPAVVQPLCQAYVLTYNEHPVEVRPSGKDLYYTITCADRV